MSLTGRIRSTGHLREIQAGDAPLGEFLPFGPFFNRGFTAAFGGNGT